MTMTETERRRVFDTTTVQRLVDRIVGECARFAKHYKRVTGARVSADEELGPCVQQILFSVAAMLPEEAASAVQLVLLEEGFAEFREEVKRG